MQDCDSGAIALHFFSGTFLRAERFVRSCTNSPVLRIKPLGGDLPAAWLSLTVDQKGGGTMRVAQVAPLTEAVPPRLYGGTERVVHWLTEELVALGHAVILFGSGDSR